MSPSSEAVWLLLISFTVLFHLATGQQQQQQQQHEKHEKHEKQATNQQGPFPGVSKDLGAFCAARPSLPIELASMIVHVKRNTSFNYKLYLFSGDHVFQTGQVIPRDDFRVHSFPVRVKRFHEFWPAAAAAAQSPRNSSSFLAASNEANFDLKEFFRLVSLDEARGRQRPLLAPEDAAGEALPGDSRPREPFISRGHSAGSRLTTSAPPERANLNEFIEFDRDDQVSPLNLAHPNSSPHSTPSSSGRSHAQQESHASRKQAAGAFEQLVLPVGAFSSFHVNLTYLVRKDFDQAQPQLIKLVVDANKFQVTHWQVINNGSGHGLHLSAAAVEDKSGAAEEADFGFLSHKLLRNSDTRITSINQIYEDWITRNFYTIVYVQRRLFDDDSDDHDAGDHRDETTKRRRKTVQLINERLVFRGSSATLLGAEQLEYQVKAAAFITEKNGLHYYLEFLDTGKFYLCAVDWQKRPFKIIDWQQFPIKATRTQFDNEELLLCPPAVCYSNRPIDEIVAYGRLDLDDQIQRQITQQMSFSRQQQQLKSSGRQHSVDFRSRDADRMHSRAGQVGETSAPINLSTSVTGDDEGGDKFGVDPATQRLRSRSPAAAPGDGDPLQLLDLNRLIGVVKISAGKGDQLQTKLHLRDWVWPLVSSISSSSSSSRRALLPDDNINIKPTPGGNWATFRWRYEQAKRNEMKAKQDAYGYTLAGHEIDASYRVYNELYLVSANHLIAINYTLANETVVSSVPVSDEFPGLVSSLIDPITGAFYDRLTNRLYFFKGDRYIGFDYATKKPLEEFILKPSYLHTALWGGLEATDDDGESSDGGTGPRLLSSRPVVEILGRQHQVDAVYHDFATDFVYIFTGMKFYTFHAHEFKGGAFSRIKSDGELPQMECINERFLDGCNFDKAYPNPCRSADGLDGRKPTSSAGKLIQAPAGHDEPPTSVTIVESLKDFSQEQQQKLRSIASKAGLLNVLLENSLVGKGINTLEPLVESIRSVDHTVREPSSRDQEKLVIYLLMAIVVVTTLVMIVMILAMVSSALRRSKTCRSQQAVLEQLKPSQLPRHSAEKIVSTQAVKRQTSSHHYLSNQQQSRLRPYHVPVVASNRSSSQASGKPVSTFGDVTTSKSQWHRNGVDSSVL